MATDIKGTQGYADEAAQLLVRYESIAFVESHSTVLDFLPTKPCSVLDIGAGTGRDAAYFSETGHRVVAVEPTDALRIAAARLHPSPSIEWIADALPDLRSVVEREKLFDLAMLTAVWMHLDTSERARGMPILASLVRHGGTLIMSLRHGPVPAGRWMFDVSGEETIHLAQQERLRPVADFCTDSNPGSKQAGRCDLDPPGFQERWLECKAVKVPEQPVRRCCLHADRSGSGWPDQVDVRSAESGPPHRP